MGENRIAVIGMGPIGSLMAALLLAEGEDVVLVGRPNAHLRAVREHGLTLRGVFEAGVRPQKICGSVSELREHDVDLVFVTVKTPDLLSLMDELQPLHRPGIRYVSAQNGLDTEKVVADRMGPESAFRMVLNMGSSIVEEGVIETTFFNRPHQLGCLTEENREEAQRIARMLTDAGLETVFTDDIDMLIWKKSIMKSSLAPICALADTTLKGSIDHPMTKQVAEGALREGIEVALAVGIELPPDFFEQCMDFFNRAGYHKDSMRVDVENRKPTEIDYLNIKIMDYARQKNIPTPYLLTTASLVKALESQYAKEK